MAKLSRVRIEGTTLPSEGRDALERFLIDTAAKIRAEAGGTWEDEQPPQLQTSARGWWGRYTIRRLQ